MCLISYLGFKSAPIWTVLAGSLDSICTALASLTALKALDEEGMAGPDDAVVVWRLSSLNSAPVTTVVASLMLSCSQFSTY
jgi:hypothetical protein